MGAGGTQLSHNPQQGRTVSCTQARRATSALLAHAHEAHTRRRTLGQQRLEPGLRNARDTQVTIAFRFFRMQGTRADTHAQQASPRTLSCASSMFLCVTDLIRACTCVGAFWRANEIMRATAAWERVWVPPRSPPSTRQRLWRPCECPASAIGAGRGADRVNKPHLHRCQASHLHQRAARRLWRLLRRQRGPRHYAGAAVHTGLRGEGVREQGGQQVKFRREVRGVWARDGTGRGGRVSCDPASELRLWFAGGGGKGDGATAGRRCRPCQRHAQNVQRI